MNGKVLVTGGAGFIGSHLIDELLHRGFSVVCVDDLSLGRMENIRQCQEQPQFHFYQCDILDTQSFARVFQENSFETVFHLAANSDIQQGGIDLSVDLQRTFLTTFRVLEMMKKHGITKIVFPSTSAIYGERADLLSEKSGPWFPISFYGSAKLSSEAYVSAFVANFSFQAWIIRFPNVVGERATHGAMFDFLNKLERNPKSLEILGNGKQTKPYVYVRDLVGAILHVWQNAHEPLNCLNAGVASSTSVTRLAEIVVEEMGLTQVEFQYTGGDRGWIGDVPRFQYDLTAIHALGWKAENTSDEAVRQAIRAEVKHRASQGAPGKTP